MEVKIRNRLARFQLAQAKQDVETKSLAQVVIIITDLYKKKAGTHDLVFSEDDLREDIGEPEGELLHAALGQLKAEGRATKDAAPGYWRFD